MALRVTEVVVGQVTNFAVRAHDLPSGAVGFSFFLVTRHDTTSLALMVQCTFVTRLAAAAES
jgi:hypothetical protein